MKNTKNQIKCLQAELETKDARIVELESQIRELVFGDGKILIAPIIGNSDYVSGIAFSTKLGSGVVGEAIIHRGDRLNLDDFDVVFWFKFRKSTYLMKLFII